MQESKTFNGKRYELAKYGEEAKGTGQLYVCNICYNHLSRTVDHLFKYIDVNFETYEKIKQTL